MKYLIPVLILFVVVVATAASDTTTESDDDITTESDDDITTESDDDITTESVTDATTELVTNATTELVTNATTESVTDTTTELVTDTTTESVTVMTTENIVYLNPFSGFDITTKFPYCTRDANCGPGAKCMKAHDSCPDNTKICLCEYGRTLFNGRCVPAVINGAPCKQKTNATTGVTTSDCDTRRGLQCGPSGVCQCVSPYSSKRDKEGVTRCLKAKISEACSSNDDCGDYLACSDNKCICPDSYFEDEKVEYGCVPGRIDDKCGASNEYKACDAANGYICDGSSSDSKCKCDTGQYDQTLTVSRHRYDSMNRTVRACTSIPNVGSGCTVDFLTTGVDTKSCEEADEVCILCPPQPGSRIAVGTCVKNEDPPNEAGAGSIRVSTTVVAMAAIMVAMVILPKAEATARS
ncbi:unnamed protein product [Owenia fusiformis]|uniref:Uncharacterized protein n=1 Tax=Owenia fusiformis TaxID=6347 RepID=A0A8J1TJ67_OWEFU|nr:unnamed protein product [Owenia fusiformis]